MPVILTDGRSVEVAEIGWDKSSYHFILKTTGEDITNLITRAQKIANWPGFDQYKDNQRVYAEQPYKAAQTGVRYTNPREDLPSGALFVATETAKGTITDIGKGAISTAKTSLQTLIIFGVLGFFGYMALTKK